MVSSRPVRAILLKLPLIQRSLHFPRSIRVVRPPYLHDLVLVVVDVCGRRPLGYGRRVVPPRDLEALMCIFIVGLNVRYCIP